MGFGDNDGEKLRGGCEASTARITSPFVCSSIVSECSQLRLPFMPSTFGPTPTSLLQHPPLVVFASVSHIALLLDFPING